MIKWLAAISLLSTVSCLENGSEKQLPDLSNYTKETDLMLKVCEKLASESNAKTLHKVSVSTQTSRMINCRDFNGECDQYLGFLSAAIRHAQDEILTDIETSDLEARVEKLRASIAEGKMKIKRQNPKGGEK